MAEKKISPPEGYEKLVTALARKISIACLWHEINPKSKTFSFAHIFGGVIGHKPKPRKKKEEGSH